MPLLRVAAACPHACTGAYVKPFPNYYVLGANIRYLVDHGVVGLYEEGNGHGPGSDLDVFKAYVAEAIMWDPNRTDDESLMTEFLDAYYGPVPRKEREGETERRRDGER